MGTFGRSSEAAVERVLPGIIESKTRVPPEREGMVRRDALLDDLSASEASVVLVRAPAGFGKSTVLQQWAYRGDRRFAWVSLDPTEGDSTLFWRYVYTAIRACIPGFASHLYDELAKPGPNLLGAIIPGLLNELGTLEGPLVIVLDDYHRVQSPEVDSTIRLFARRLPRGTTLAIGTRSKPRLGVARLRSLGRVHDLGPTDLSLTLGDAASMLRTRNPDRTDEQVAWIHQASEGWPAGVYLFGLVDSLDMTLPMTSNIRDYLMTEMFSNLSRDDLRVLRESSILRYLDAAYCDHISQDDSGQVRLNRMADSNQLILPLDQSGERFRFHHLLQA